MDPTNPWEDLTQIVTLPFDLGGERRLRTFCIREMSRADCDRLTDLYFAGVESLKKEAAQLDPETMPTAQLVSRSFALQWETQDQALQMILREPLDGGPVPTLDEIRANLNERRASILTEIQDRLNGTDKAKKKATELTQAMVADAEAKKSGLSLMTASPPVTAAGQTKSLDAIPTEKPDS